MTVDNADYSARVHARAIALIRTVLEITAAAGSGHPTSAASLAHLVTILLYEHMHVDPAQPRHPGSDRLVISEGHACPIVYAAAADLGFAIGKTPGELRPMTNADAMRLRQLDSFIDGHPNPAEGFPFFDAATGSLGQGLSIAAGLALAARLQHLSRRVYCIIGDGESREGQISEALDFIIDYRLHNVCPIFNCNSYGQSAGVSAQQSAAVLEKKLTAAGFIVCRVDGHDPLAIREALRQHDQHSRKVSNPVMAVVAQTIKGWGAPLMHGNGLHGKAFSGDKLALIQAELALAAQRLAGNAQPLALPQRPLPPLPPAAKAAPIFPLPLAKSDLPNHNGKPWLSTRKAYGLALRALGIANSDIVALDADVSNSTYAQLFADEPQLQARFFECRIAEQNMLSVAVGLAVAGKVPFVSTFGKFLVRAFDQLEMAMITRANIKLVGSHCGVSLAADGPSQMALADATFCRAYAGVCNDNVPALYVLTPADAVAAYQLTIAMAQHNGACYLRTQRPDVPLLYAADTVFKLGGHQLVESGKHLLLVATGYMVHEAKKAAVILRRHGIEPTIIDLYSLPFAATPLVNLARANNHKVLTLEDNYAGAYGSSVAEVMAAAAPDVQVQQLYVKRIPKSGLTPDDLLTYVGLNADAIAAAARQQVETAAASDETVS